MRANLSGIAGGVASLPLLSLVLAPLLGLYWSTPWIVTRDHEVRNAVRVAQAPPHEPLAGEEPVELVAQVEGAHGHEGVQIPAGQALRVDLPGLVVVRAAIQADSKDTYQLLGSADGVHYVPLWNVAPVPHRQGLLTRTSPAFQPTEPLRSLLVTTVAGDDVRSVARLSLEHQVASYPPFITLAVSLWLLWGVLRLAARPSPTSRPAQWLQSRWREADAWIFALLAFALAFRVDSPLFLGALAAAGLVLAGHALRSVPRHAWAPLALGLVAAAVIAAAAQRAAEGLLLRRLEQSYDLGVDHRPRPDGHEINSDGLRFLGEAGDVRAEDFNIAFLGDSFTYGIGTPYAESYPYVFERLVSERACTAPVRAISFGWVSSSPLLSLRLLRDVGARYQPDLVLYNLDMTDFHDDLEYAAALLANEEIVYIDPGRLWSTALRHSVFGDFLRHVGEAVAASARARVPTSELTRSLGTVPSDRFFIVNQPLDLSRPFIEAGVMRNLEELNGYSRETLAAPFAVVLYPRAFQYSREESPQSWENPEYEILGEHSLAPFHYFAEVASELPYPVLDLTPAFRTSPRFPLFRHDDPHWTPAGNEVAAQALLDELLAAGLLPCE